MKRKIIRIDKEKCNGCGACVNACHEGAIGLENSKAVLLREDYCDGLGDCLPACPANAISFEEREAAAYDEKAVMENKTKQTAHTRSDIHSCPGSMAKSIKRETVSDSAASCCMESQLSQWPVQIKLMPITAPYYNGAKLLVAADCTAYAYSNFHNKFIRNHITLVGCPKLDSVDYSEKLTEIIRNNDIKSITVVRMEVPCCGGIENAVKKALINSGKMLPCNVVVISTDGNEKD